MSRDSSRVEHYSNGIASDRLRGPASTIQQYCRRCRGIPGKKRPPRHPWSALALSLVASSFGILAVSSFHYVFFVASAQTYAMLIGSFGATAVLLYSAPAAPLSQPRNVLGGHVISSLVGVAVRMAIVERGGAPEWVGCALAVSLAIVAMMVTETLHPPGGASALIAVTGDDTLRRLGFLFALVPAGSGAALMLVVALVMMNLREESRYPQYWW